MRPFVPMEQIKNEITTTRVQRQVVARPIPAAQPHWFGDAAYVWPSPRARFEKNGDEPRRLFFSSLLP